MPDDSPVDRARRTFLKRTLAACGGATLAGLAAAGCGAPEEGGVTRPDGGVQTPTGEEPQPSPSAEAAGCQPSDNLSQQSLDVRHALDYTPQTPQEGERCDNCRFYVPPEGEGGCGGCDHFAGPVTAAGWCTVWDVERA